MYNIRLHPRKCHKQEGVSVAILFMYYCIVLEDVVISCPFYSTLEKKERYLFNYQDCTRIFTKKKDGH